MSNKTTNALSIEDDAVREHNQKMKEACKEAIIARIGGNKAHGWGVNDQLEIVMVAIATEVGGEREDYRDSELELIIREQLNGSAFRQKLVTAKYLDDGKKEKTAKSGVLL